MASSDRFASYMRGLNKKRREYDEEGLRGQIIRSFHTCMSEFPEPMRNDLLIHFMGTYAPEGVDRETLLSAADTLQRVVELFDGEYERGEDDLTDTDWEMIKQTVDDFALDLDTDLITYIMRYIVKRGLMG